MSRWKTVESHPILRKILAAGLLLWVAAPWAPVWAEDPDSPPPPPPPPTEDDGPVDRDTDILTFTAGDPQESLQIGAGVAGPPAPVAEGRRRDGRGLEQFLRDLVGALFRGTGATSPPDPGRGSAGGAHRGSP